MCARHAPPLGNASSLTTDVITRQKRAETSPSPSKLSPSLFFFHHARQGSRGRWNGTMARVEAWKSGRNRVGTEFDGEVSSIARPAPSRSYGRRTAQSCTCIPRRYATPHYSARPKLTFPQLSAQFRINRARSLGPRIRRRPLRPQLRIAPNFDASSNQNMRVQGTTKEIFFIPRFLTSFFLFLLNKYGVEGESGRLELR